VRAEFLRAAKQTFKQSWRSLS